MAFLAKECGWDHNYIADHFTLQQINKYYERIQLQKMREAQLQGIVTMYAVARAFGSIKAGEFKSFLDKLDPRTKEDINKAIDKMKSKKLNIEDK